MVSTSNVVVRSKGLDTFAANERICLEDEHTLCSRLRHIGAGTEKQSERHAGRDVERRSERGTQGDT